MSAANVQVDAIRDFRTALIKYLEVANVALADGESEVMRTLHWLELEQLPFWQQRIRKYEEEVGRWKEAIRQKTLYKDSTGGKSSAVDEKKKLQQAEARLADAHHRFLATKQYVKRVQKQHDEFRGQVQKLGMTLGGEGKDTVAKLTHLERILGEYLKSEAPTESKSMAQAEPVAPVQTEKSE